MAKGMTKIVTELLEGVVGVSGSLAMSLWLSVMKTLPTDLPKLVCCTVTFLPFAEPGTGRNFSAVLISLALEALGQADQRPKPDR